MIPRYGEKSLREAVGVFNDAASLEAAIDEIESAGFDRADITVLAGKRTVAEKLGHAYEKVEALEDDAAAPRAAFISTESRGDAEGAVVGGLVYVGAVAASGAVLLSGGTVAGGIAAALLAGGAGGVIGSALAALIGQHHADYLQNQLDHGGLLLWVRTADAEHEKRACEILRKHSARDVHVHALVNGQAT